MAPLHRMAGRVLRVHDHPKAWRYGMVAVSLQDFPLPGAPLLLSFCISFSFSSYTSCTLLVVREGQDAQRARVHLASPSPISAHSQRIHLPANQGVFVGSWSNTIVIQIVSLGPNILYDEHQYRVPCLRVGHQHLSARASGPVDVRLSMQNYRRTPTLDTDGPHTQWDLETLLMTACAPSH
ncbi:hypothetical protein EDB92DRAFT_1864131 [Lactarius akahatsu]|uniref:Uncharacterized protein n=1 Tax=Lactarius akahatsu TaxID=416441 RepID=A0AAD4LEF7_9AGAM|nr:hypothetical protein EDB92DRAFT_1864131 [Lactarius akahatsu]